MGAGRNTRRWYRTREALRSEARRLDLPCWLCGQRIDWAAEWPDPWSFSADHIVPVSVDASTADEREAIRPAHLRCNLRRGDRAPMPAPDLGDVGETW